MRYVFTSSNTSQGFYTFIPELIMGLARVYILKGAAGTGKSTFIRLLGESLSEQGYEVEFWVSADDGISPDGVYIPQLQAAVVNGSLPLPVDPHYPGSPEIIINLGQYGDKQIINSHRHTIDTLVEEFRRHHSQAIRSLKGVARLKEQVKRIAGAHLNLEKINELVEKLTSEIMENPVTEKHYFASVVTAEGMINYLDELSSECRKRYIFKGPSGSAKSTVIREVAAQARQRGYLVEYYHCGIDPENIVMVIVKNLQLALIDAGNIEILAKPWDIIIDMNICLDDNQIDYNDVRTSENIRDIESLMIKAQNELGAAAATVKELKKIYTSAMNFEALDRRRHEVREAISRRE